jgi:hypothetical protein
LQLNPSNRLGAFPVAIDRAQAAERTGAPVRLGESLSETLRRGWARRGMDFLSSLLVPILAVAVVFLAGHLLLRLTRLGAGQNPRWLLVAAIAWALYAAWEWLILVRTPEANIRVDLLVNWPVLALLSAWALFRLFR